MESEQAHSSSAYSSLANSNCDVNSEASNSSSTHAGVSTTATVVKTPTNLNRRSNSSQKIQSLNSNNLGAMPNTSEEIRAIVDDYNKTLKQATAQIKNLTKERNSLEFEYEKLLTLNEGLANDLEKSLRLKRRLEEEHDNVLKANEELFEEAQRLNDEESSWIGNNLCVEFGSCQSIIWNISLAKGRLHAG